MTDAVTVALIALSVPATLAAASLWRQHVANKERKEAEKRATDQAAAIQASVAHVETKVDGRFTELLNLVLKMSKANGFKDGMAAGKAENKEEGDQPPFKAAP